MRVKNQNMEATFADDKDVFVDEVEPSDPIYDEAERLRKELASERDQFLRLAAEFDNYRRRVKQERVEAAEYGKRELLTQLVTIADDFELAIAHLDEKSGQVAEGLQMIRRRFSVLLRANGVDPFESKGEIFDPELHEAFDVIASGENKSGTVQTEVRRGYFWNGKLLRAALVVVEK